MPTPVNERIDLDAKKYIVSKTDPKGIIEYGNDYFVEISGYKESELIGHPHNIIRHPDMPRVIFKMMWDRIKNRQNIMAVVKNMAKDGRHYWVVTDFEPKTDKITNEIISFTAYRKAASDAVIKSMEALYQRLREIESESGIEGAEKYLRGFLEDKNKSYDEFINELVGNKGLFKIFFTTMKKLFG